MPASGQKTPSMIGSQSIAVTPCSGDIDRIDNIRAEVGDSSCTIWSQSAVTPPCYGFRQDRQYLSKHEGGGIEAAPLVGP